MDDQVDAELQNPFPSPPSHYSNYTQHNLALLDLLKTRSDAASFEQQSQQEILADQKDVPDWPLDQLEKPRVDWILEDGYYNVFGDTWFVKETIPSLADQGGQQLYPTDPSIDRRPVLRVILRSLLVTYSTLTSALLLPPPTESSTDPPEWKRHVEWITIMAQNILAAANDLRPVQARANLEVMMKRQLELRREETRALHQKCDDLEAKLAELRVYAQQASDVDAMLVTDGASPPPDSRRSHISDEDVLRWAEQA